MNKLVGTGFDGGSSIFRLYKGAQAEIQKLYSLALYMHCASHYLYLCLVNISRLDLIQILYGYLQKVVVLSYSRKRTEQLASALPHTKSKSSFTFVTQGGSEIHNNTVTFLELFPAVVGVLERFVDNLSNSGLIAKANSVVAAIAQFSFIFPLILV